MSKTIECEMYLIWMDGTWNTEVFDVPECLLGDPDKQDTVVENWWTEVHGLKAQYQGLSAVKVYNYSFDD